MKVLFASVLASFAAGFGVAWYLQPSPAPALVASTRTVDAPAWPPGVQRPGPPLPWTAPPSAIGAPGLQQAGVDELWRKALVPHDKQETGYAAEDRLRQLVQTDPTARRKLLQRFHIANTLEERELFKSIMSTVRTPEVIAFSHSLASSLNVSERKFGFEMLQALAPNAPETRSLVRRALVSEQSPAVLVQALATLRPGVTEPEEASALVAQLKSLSVHADPAVRSMSLTQLGQLDKTGEGSERLAQALSDGVPEVRQAAIFAIAQTGLRSEPLKLGLLALVNNAQESREVRGSALQVLERFPLTREEVASYTQARGRILGL